MKNRGFRGVIGWAALLLLFFTQVAYGEGTGSFVVSGTGNYLYSNSVLTVSSGEVTVSTPNYQTFEVIRLTGGKLILNGVWISTDISSPIEVDGIAEIHLAKGSTNTLTATAKNIAGIHVPSQSKVTFTGEGTLIAENTIEGFNSSSAGIGGQQGTYSCGTIIFDLLGMVTAKGGGMAAGIGTCMKQAANNNEASGTILIKNGTINATGGHYAAGIGTGPDGSSGGGVSVTIEGGTVNAWGGESSYGIGTGVLCNTPVDIFLLGGIVTADIKPHPARSFKTLVIGPDVSVNGEITRSYNNGFVFSGNPKSATVKENPVLPAQQELKINSGETLTVPNGKTLTNNGSIINNGKIANNGTINGNGKFSGNGLILGNTPSNWSGNTAYITYNTNGGKGAVDETYHKAGSVISFPSTEGLSREGYTCLGWNNYQYATTALESYTVTKGANTLYAVWAKNVELTSNTQEITGTVGKAFNEVDLSTNVNKNAVSEVTFNVKEGSTLPTGFSLTEPGVLTGPNLLTTAMSNQEVIVAVTPKNGAQPVDLTLTFNIAKGRSTISINDYSITYGEEPVKVATTKTGSTKDVVLSYYTDEDCTNDESSDQPTDAGTYYVKAEVAEDDNYNAASVKATFVIKKKELIITPDANQFVYTNEAGTYVPTYTVGKAVGQEKPKFNDGKLSWDEGTGDQNIKVGSLTLVDNDAFKAINYDLTLSSPSVTINVLSESLADTYTNVAKDLATEVAGSATDGWHKASITLKAPTDFKLKAVTNLRDASDWEKELVISQEGKYDFKYQLLRDGRDEASASTEHTLPIQLDLTLPELKGAPTINNLTATFTLADATSGIASYSYQLDDASSAQIIYVDGAPKEHPVQITAAAGQHKISFTIWDVAGNEATISDIIFTLNDPETPPDNNTDWTPDNNPQPVYYNVTLPDIEGATFDRGAGDHEVEAWSSFIFHLTLAEGYKKNSHPVVTTDRGETIAPRQSDGAYVVGAVRSDVNVSVSGIVPDNATGIADIESATRIRVVGRTLHITVSKEAEAYICDMSGCMLPLQKLAPGTNRVNVKSPGIYIIKIIGEKEQKAIVQ